MSERVHIPKEDPFDNIRHVAIAITLLRDPEGQKHVGILHRNESDQEIRMLHLAWHYQLSNSKPKTCYAWIEPPIPHRRARQVAAFCRQVIQGNRSGIPYAFSSASDCFNEQTGTFMLGPDRHGLTCASFILGVFHSTGLPLIQYNTWPKDREGDKEWQQFVIEILKKSGASADHISHVESEVGAVRFRPEEIAGAGAGNNIPASFEEADKLAKEVIAKLQANNIFNH